MLTAPEGWHFAGILVNPYDGQSYLAKMRQGADGYWLFHLTYTPEPHDGAFIFLFYIALGHLAVLTHLPLIVVFHLARLSAGLILLLIVFRFIAQVTAEASERRQAFIFVLTASGLGWLGVLFGAFPINLWVPEAFVPYSLYANPHFPLAMALMLVILERTVLIPFKAELTQSQPSPQPSPFGRGSIASPPLGGIEGERSIATSLLLTALTALALALILPFALLTVWAVLGVYLAWHYVMIRRLPWQSIWHTLAVGLSSAPVIYYDYWVSRTNPILAGWSMQNVTPAPNLLDFWLGYGLVGMLAVWGGWLVVRSRRGSDPPFNPGLWLVLLWAVTTIVLVYLPLDLQRRFINGLHIPLCILAAIGLQRGLVTLRWRLPRRRVAVGGVVVAGLVGTLFVWLLPLFGLLQPPDESPTTALFFERQGEIEIFIWLRENIQVDQIILASPRLGVFLPGQTGARVFYGHPFETIEADQKKAQVEAFYRGDIDSLNPPVDFIIYGPSEQTIGRPKNLAAYPVVFSTENMTIYLFSAPPGKGLAK